MNLRVLTAKFNKADTFKIHKHIIIFTNMYVTDKMIVL